MIHEVSVAKKDAIWSLWPGTNWSIIVQILGLCNKSVPSAWDGLSWPPPMYLVGTGRKGRVRKFVLLEWSSLVIGSTALAVCCYISCLTSLCPHCLICRVGLGFLHCRAVWGLTLSSFTVCRHSSKCSVLTQRSLPGPCEGGIIIIPTFRWGHRT